MKRAAQLRRDLVVAFEGVMGLSQQEIANRHGICTRTVRRAIRRVEALQGEQPRGQVLGRLDEYWLHLTASIEDLAAARLNARNPRTLVAAIRKQADLMKEQTELLVRLSQLEGERPDS